VISAAAQAILAFGVLWHAVHPGVWEREFPMADRGPLAGVRVVALRFDPARVTFGLAEATTDYGLRAAWNVDSLPDQATAAFNAGQFIGGSPWGWLVRDGVEVQPPGPGTLVMSFVVDRSGTVSLVMPNELPALRRRAMLGFQSYRPCLPATASTRNRRPGCGGIDPP
jgi:hypothetical protein